MAVSAIHHLRINVSNLVRSKRFYEPILLWVGFEDIGAHYGPGGRLERLRYKKQGFLLLLSEAEQTGKQDRTTAGLHHLAFAVTSSEEVDRFYEEVIVRIPDVVVEDPPVDCPEYADGYYATFFYDPDGVKLEVVYSIGQCNILPTNLIIGDVAHGSNGTTRIVRVTEVGGMASMEERPVA